jgi:nitroreductase
LPFVCLARGDCRRLAARLSCDQDIAADGFFSLGMLADFDASLDAYGPSFYRNLFWESGVVGQVLYLEAEAVGARATGIGCFFDDPVHDVLGLQEHAFQSLYHFTVGMAVEDPRLRREPGYDWELEG